MAIKITDPAARIIDHKLRRRWYEDDSAEYPKKLLDTVVPWYVRLFWWLKGK